MFGAIVIHHRGLLWSTGSFAVAESLLVQLLLVSLYPWV
uniref:Uncharacterized protein n=1 Tax=Anguilla anguilla TaxID=7936 RepID=A0A0E9SP11_ANGAN